VSLYKNKQQGKCASLKLSESEIRVAAAECEMLNLYLYIYPHQAGMANFLCSRLFPCSLFFQT